MHHKCLLGDQLTRGSVGCPTTYVITPDSEVPNFRSDHPPPYRAVRGEVLKDSRLH